MSGRRATVVLVACLVLAGQVPRGPCGATGSAHAAEPTLAELVEELGSTEVAKRSAAYRSLRDRADPGVLPLLAARLDAFPLAGQQVGVILLDRFDDAQLRKPLRRLLTCTSPYLRASAALMLHQRGAKGMVKRLLAELRSDDLPRAAWKQIMTRFSGGRLPADPRLVALLVEPVVVGADATTLRTTADVLGSAQADAAIPAFEALLADERPGMRAVAATFLRGRGQDRDAELAAALRTGRCTSTDVYFVRSAVTRIGAPPAAPVIAEALLAATSVPMRPTALRAVVQFLAKLADERALPRLRELTEHESSLVAKAAADAVAALSGAGGATTTTSLRLSTDETRALTRMTRERDADALRAWLGHENAFRRLAAADALRRMDDHSGFEAVLALCDAESLAERREAVRVLGPFRAAAALDRLIEATVDADETVRNFARIALNLTLLALFPHRRFDVHARGERDDADARAARAERLRQWWSRARDAAW